MGHHDQKDSWLALGTLAGPLGYSAGSRGAGSTSGGGWRSEQAQSCICCTMKRQQKSKIFRISEIMSSLPPQAMGQRALF